MFDENLETEYELKDDILYIKGTETYIPGILDKTIKAFSYINNNYDFDYIIRSNISTIVNFTLLTEYLQNISIQYGGGYKLIYYNDRFNTGDIEYASGTSIILSKNSLTKVLDNKQYIRYDIIDDVVLGLLFRDYLSHIEQHYIPTEYFCWFPNLDGNIDEILKLIKNQSYIFYRNKQELKSSNELFNSSGEKTSPQEDRKIDVKQMNIIINYLIS